MPSPSRSAAHNESGPVVSDLDAETAEQLYRANAYGLLGALLHSAPDHEMLERLGGLADTPRERDELGVAMALLGLAARGSDPMSLEDEFYELFIGIGRGELVPFGSWYQTGFLMERPLGLLRSDLREQGYVRAEESQEPEDHVAALCEVLGLLVRDGAPIALQRRFFEAHVGRWMRQFFADLEQAEAAAFYKAVGRFGTAFLAFEQEYLSMPA